jgi:hypothetical protein
MPLYLPNLTTPIELQYGHLISFSIFYPTFVNIDTPAISLYNPSMPLTGKWYPFKDNVVDLAPEQSGAYELGYKDVVVYIGSSESSIRSRLCEHRKAKRFSRVTDFRFRKTSPYEARALETKLCVEFVKRNGKRPRLQKRCCQEAESLISVSRLLYGR